METERQFNPKEMAIDLFERALFDIMGSDRYDENRDSFTKEEYSLALTFTSRMVMNLVEELSVMDTVLVDNDDTIDLHPNVKYWCNVHTELINKYVGTYGINGMPNDTKLW